MKETWIDVSHILGWGSTLSGIERVEYHLIKHYFLNTDAGFIAWDKETHSFYEIDRARVKREIVERTSEQELLAEKQSDYQVSILNRVGKKLKITSKSKPQKWHEDGTVIVLAGLWDDKDYIESIKRIADRNKLTHIVYDMIPLVRPGFVVDFLPAVFGEYMLTVLPKCQLIMAISEATKNDVESVLKSHGLSIPKVISFRLGDELTRSKQASRPSGVPDEFILSVGTIEVRKNHQLLYYTYQLANEKGIKLPPLVIAGRRGWLTGDFQYMVEHDLIAKEKIKILDKVSDSEMQWLYENCLFTVFPSFYEGWGLPVAESLGYGKVTLASDKSSIIEVGGENVDYFSPYSSNELLKLMQTYIERDSITKREELISANYVPVKWSRATAVFEQKTNQL